MRNRIRLIARYIYARLLYIALTRQIAVLMSAHRMKEAHHATKHRRRLGHLLSGANK